jgi:hypothetical protein
MKMNPLLLGMASVAGLAVAVSAQAASVYDELRTNNPTAADQVDRGEQVTLTQKAQGPWPKAWVYRIIDARPEEVAAVFWDFPSHKEFYPGVYKSEISNRVSSTTLEVDYSVSVQVFPDEHYTVRDTLSTYEEGGRAYKVEWTKVRATSTRHIEGYILIEPHRGKTIIEYYNYIIPGNSLAGFPGVPGKAMAQLNSTVAALGNETERRRREQAGPLADLVRQLQNALGQ